jgi:hypothetical protein
MTESNLSEAVRRVSSERQKDRADALAGTDARLQTHRFSMT